MTIDSLSGLSSEPNKVPPQLPTVGRIVHYVIPSGDNKGEHRAAMITGVCQFGENSYTVNLTVYRDDMNDPVYESQLQLGIDQLINVETVNTRPLFHATVVHYHAMAMPGTWHYPER